MAPQLREFTLPLRVDENEDIRVGNTRVLLDMIIHAHRDGDSPEQIVQSFDSLQLPDVYAAIAYYLRNREDMDAYVDDREKAGASLRNEIEAQPRSKDFDARLLARIGRAAPITI